jgi:hypothetical protein
LLIAGLFLLFGCIDNHPDVNGKPPPTICPGPICAVLMNLFENLVFGILHESISNLQGGSQLSNKTYSAEPGLARFQKKEGGTKMHH